MSASWLARTLTLDRWFPKMGSLSLRHFGLPPAQPLRVALVDLTARYLRAWQPVPPCPQFDHYAYFPASSPSFLPLPTAAFSIITMAKRNTMAEELLARTESNGYKRAKRGHTPHAVLHVSISRAEQIRLACSLLRCVHRRYTVLHSFEHWTRDSCPRDD